VARIIVQETRGAMWQHRKQQETLIGLKLNRIGRIAELPDTRQTRGMIAKVAHLVRIIAQETELDCFVRAVRAEYHELITTRIGPAKVYGRSSRPRSKPAGHLYIEGEDSPTAHGGMSFL
jgi:large subunit ribosomal protein L30